MDHMLEPLSKIHLFLLQVALGRSHNHARADVVNMEHYLTKLWTQRSGGLFTGAHAHSETETAFWPDVCLSYVGRTSNHAVGGWIPDLWHVVGFDCPEVRNCACSGTRERSHSTSAPSRAGVLVNSQRFLQTDQSDYTFANMTAC